MSHRSHQLAIRLLRGAVLAGLVAFVAAPVSSKRAPSVPARTSMAAAVLPRPARAPLATAVQAVNALQKEALRSWNVRWSSETGLPRMMLAGQSRAYTGSVAEAAASFLGDHRTLFALDSVAGGMISAVRQLNQQQLPGGTKVTFEQSAGGIPVVDAQIGVIVDGSGSVVHISSSARQIPAVDTVPAVFTTAAIAMATAAVGKPRITGSDPAPRLVIYPSDPPRLAYEIRLTFDAGFGEPWRFVIDAHDGTVLLQRRMVLDADTSFVFDPNPVATLNDTTLLDHNDNDSAVPLAGYRTVVLQHLDPAVGGVYSLKGSYAVMQNMELPNNTPPTSQDSSFLLLRRDNDFEEVMVYHTIDQSQVYIQSLGFTNADNRRHQLDAHGYGGADNSHYVQSVVGAGYIAYGDGGVDDAEDADIILHEYGHSIQDNSSHGIYFGIANNGYGDETGAMGEGFGDYWGASAGYDSSVAHGFPTAYVGEWDSKGYTPTGEPYLRVVNSGKVYPADMSDEVHNDGEIWSAALWDLFGSVGRTVADRLVLYSHFLVPTTPDFADGANALLAADAVLYPAAAKSGAVVYGIHYEQICNAMSAHGILNCPAICDCSHTGDPNNDGVIDLFDIIFTIDEVFSGGPQAPKDPYCPHLSRSDYNCDNFIDVFDVAYAIEYVFSGGPGVCDACGP
ncbi:MAG: M36 family metallopeptidase [candidate division Zixibacteria bacterium]|nr:M36 family metallopeptidase [candidate division Zixibacteria bacterium]